MDGTEVYLQAVGTSPPAGEDFNAPEVIVEREPGTEITVRRRGQD